MRLMLFFLILPIPFLPVFFTVDFIKMSFISVYNTYRPMFLDGGGKSCIEELIHREAVFKPLGNTGTAICPVKNAVKITTFKNTTPSSPFIATCSTALALHDWLAENRIKNFKHLGTINCRKMRGKDLQSEHSYGTAIDISAVDGASVSKEWGKNSSGGHKLRKVSVSACRHFSNVLTPETNKLHRDHFHFDNGFGNRCGAKMNFNLR
jgi:hypothetical protein